MCICKTPNPTSENNRFICDDGTESSCWFSYACFSSELFPQAEFQNLGCKEPSYDSNPDVLHADVSASAQTQGYTGSYAKTGDLHKGFPIYKGPNNKLLYINDDSNWCFGSEIEVNTCDLQSSSTSHQFVQAMCPADVETWYFYNPDLAQWQPGVFTISVTRIDGKC